MATMGEPWETKTTGIRDGEGAGTGMGTSFGAAQAVMPEMPPATASFRTSRRDRSISLFNPGRSAIHPETGVAGSEILPPRGATGACGAVLRGVRDEVVHLDMEVVRPAAQRSLEKARGLAHRALLAGAVRQVRQPDEVDDERRRERRVASLPRELQRHPRPEEAFEVDEVPGRLPVAERRDVVDPHA